MLQIPSIMLPNLIISCLLMSVVSVHSLPSFEWDMSRVSVNGVPLLNIRFPNGDVDQAVLHTVNPIPQLENEKEEDVDNCIFSGNLMNEPDVVVTVAGCTYDDKFEIALNSARLNGNIYMVKKGVAQRIEAPNGIEHLDTEAPDFEEEILQTASNRKALPSSGFILRMRVAYDQLFKAKCEAESISPANAIRKIIAFTQDIYRWASLTTTVRIDLVAIDELDISITGGASHANLKKVRALNQDDSINANMYLTFRGHEFGAAGTAYTGGVCMKIRWRSSLSEFLISDANTGRIMAHELGHLLGMEHDFGKKRESRVDSQGNPCTNVGGLMDYGQNPFIRFSPCSVENFTANYNKYPNYCLALDDGTLSTFVPTPPPTTSGAPTSPCVIEMNYIEFCDKYCSKFEDKSANTCYPAGESGIRCSCTLYK